mmetsp:Transcript_43412/g.63617  ORF Transcript_43412/g.63617 Transcript_43412/m.63617 type:complete len:448 (-) Transcript_43412:40-1383(-)
MSFRELRNLTEMMRSLGFPRLISVENFRTPNFALVAEILSWMVERYDPDIPISDIIDTETDRVEFLTSICTSLASKAHLKLNAKRLYAADGYAVKELLKLASLLYRASKVQASIAAGTAEGEDLDANTPLNAQLANIKEARQLAGELTDRGARLYDLLGAEGPARRARLKALAFLDAVAGNLDSAAEHRYIEKSVRDLIRQAGDSIASLTKQVEDLEADEKALDQKIKKKSADLERGEKRLRSLQTVRPAFMDEYEKLEQDLQRQYEVYMEKFRNLDYLEHELDKYRRAEEAALAEAERRVQKISAALLRQEREVFIQGGQEGIGDQDVNQLMSSMKPGQRGGGPEMGRVSKNGRPVGGGGGGGYVEGSMGNLSDESSESSGEGEGEDDEGSAGEGDGSSGSESVSMGSEMSGSESENLIEDDGGSGSSGRDYPDGAEYSGSDDSNF